MTRFGSALCLGAILASVLPCRLQSQTRLRITSPEDLPRGTVGQTYRYVLQGSGGTPPYAWLATGGTLPAGLTLGLLSGAITGTPSAVGDYRFRVTLADRSLDDDSMTFNLRVAAASAPVISTSTLPPGAVGVFYSQLLAATGGTAPYAFAISSGTLPAGLTMSSAGAITGTPSAAGTSSFTARVTDSANQSSTKPLQIVVNAALAIATTNLPAAVIGVNYSETLMAGGGTPPYVWSITSGSLPQGLSLSPGGAISGSPTTGGGFDFTARVADSSSQSASQPLRIVVNAAPVISTSSLQAATVGAQYSQALTATGGAPPYSWNLAGGALPGGVALSSGGTLSGVPSAAGTFNFTAQVTDANTLSASKPLQLVVNPAPTPPSITTNALSPGTVGVAYSQTLAASGGVAPYVWSIAGGALPAGITLTPIGTFTGTPTAAGTFEFTARVTDANKLTGDKPLQIVIAPAPVPPTITTAVLPAGTVGSAYSQILVAAGGVTPYVWSVATGTLPAGITLAPSGTLTGTPTAAGTFDFTARVTDANKLIGDKPLQIVIAPAPVPPSITTAALPGGTVGTAYSQTLAATGGVTPYVWSVASGALPAGITLAPTGALTGTPTAAGTFDFTARVTDANNLSASKPLQIVIAPAPVPPTITTASLPGGTVGTAYSQTLAATGGLTPYVWSVATGTLPAGITLAPSGALTGTPSAAGTSDFTARVTDANNLSASKPLQIVISAAPTPPNITTTTLASGTVGSAYSETLSASGGRTPYTWTIASGNLPAGLTLSTAGAITGTPTTAGDTVFTVRVTDANNLSDSEPLQIDIFAAPVPPTITTATLPAATEGVAYSQSLSASGGKTPYIWALTSGALPAGVSLAPSGVIAGTPTASGTFDFNVSVTDAGNLSASKALQLLVNPAPPVITTTALPAATVATDYSVNLTATRGRTPYTWAVASGTLPAGLTLTPAGVLGGTPTVTGTFDFTVRVTDANSLTDSKALQIVVSAAPTPPSITSGAPPAGTAGTPYSFTFTAGGGRLPYVWTVSSGALPPGLTLNSSAVLSGTPASAGTYDFSVRVTDANSLSNTRNYQITIGTAPVPPTITTTTLPAATAGTPYAQSLTANGGTPPYNWTLTSGALPQALSLSPTGTISGTPAAAGTFDFTLTVTDSRELSASGSLRLIVNAAATPPSITTTALPSGTAGVAYTQTLAATAGTPPYSWAVASGSLPPGLTLSTAGVLSGTPAAAATSDFSVRITDARNLSDTKALRIVINAPVTPPSISTTTFPGGTAGAGYSAMVSVSGGTPPYTWSVANGVLPPGLILTPSTGEIRGTPNQAGSFSFSLRVADSAGRSSERLLTILIGEPITVQSCITATGQTGVPYFSQFTSSGGTAPRIWSITGQIPTGLALNSSAGIVTGTPVSAGTYTFLVRVNDAANQTATRSCTVVITAPVRIVTETLNDATTRARYSQAPIAAGGTQPYRWAVSAGSLPPGLTLDTATGLISGFPTLTGRFTFTLTVTDAVGTAASKSYAIGVVAGVTIPACPFPATGAGQQYSATLTAIGGQPPYTWSLVSGALPAGLTLASDSGTLSGAPATPGSSSFTLLVTDASGFTANRQCSITVSAELGISTAALSNGSLGSPYSETIAATGGTAPYVWVISDGVAPVGLALNAATGVLSGAPTQAGSFQFTARVTDASGLSATKAFRVEITAGFSISACPAAAATLGQPYSSALSIVGGETPLAWSVSSGALPPGLSLDGASGTVTGTPSQLGSFSFVTRVADRTSAQTTRSCTIIVSNPVLSIAGPEPLPNAILSQPYDQPLRAAGGREPYLWALASGTLPPGVTLSADGMLRGTPTESGIFQFTARVTDQDRGAATRAFSLTVLPGPAPAISFEGLPEIIAPAQQPRVNFVLENGYPAALTGKVNLRFTPDPGVDVDDRSIRFITGERTVNFEIPANSRNPIFPVPQLALQTGTVAGTLELSIQLAAGELDVTPEPMPQRTIRVDRTAPIITNVQVNRTPAGFEVLVTGFSTTREVTSATFQFTPAAGSRLDTNQVTIQTTDAARQWFRDPRSFDFGGQFTFVQPFSVQGATLSEVSVTLTNGQGTSQPGRARF